MQVIEYVVIVVVTILEEKHADPDEFVNRTRITHCKGEQVFRYGISALQRSDKFKLGWLESQTGAAVAIFK